MGIVSLIFTGSETSPEGLSELSQGPWLLKCNIPIGQSGQLQSPCCVVGIQVDINGSSMTKENDVYFESQIWTALYGMDAS